MGEGLYWDADGVTVFAEPTDDLDPDDVIEHEIAWGDFVATARAAVSARWRRAGALWRHGAAVLAQSGLHLLTLYEDSYARAHLTVAMRSDLEPPLEARARAGLHRVAVPVFARVARRYPLRTRTTAWTSAPWSPPVRTPDASLTTAPAHNLGDRPMTDTNNPATPPAATPDSDTLYAEYLRREAAERAAEREDLATLRPQLLALARAAGAATITGRYEGGGDSGVMDAIHVEPETADAALQATSLPRPVQRWNAETRIYETILAQTPFHDCVRDMLTTLLTHRVGNWWDGGDIESSGEVVWHVGDDPDRITGEHTLTTRSSEYDEWEDPDPEDDAADLHPATGV